jgi:Flp pilus assembly protein TadG
MRKPMNRTRDRRGVMTVEMAVIAPILILMLFAAIELGLIIRDTIGMHTLAHQAGRLAAKGRTTCDVINSVVSTPSSLNTGALSTTLEKMPFDEDAGTFGSWTALGNNGVINDAHDGDRIRVTITYDHELVSGGVIPILVDDAEAGTSELTASIIVRRE